MVNLILFFQYNAIAEMDRPILILYYPDDISAAEALQTTLFKSGIASTLWDFMEVNNIDKSAFIVPLIVVSTGSSKMFTYDGYFSCLGIDGKLPKEMLIVKSQDTNIIESRYPIASFEKNDFSEVVKTLKTMLNES